MGVAPPHVAVAVKPTLVPRLAVLRGFADRTTLVQVAVPPSLERASKLDPRVSSTGDDSPWPLHAATSNPANNIFTLFVMANTLPIETD